MVGGKLFNVGSKISPMRRCLPAPDGPFGHEGQNVVARALKDGHYLLGLYPNALIFVFHGLFSPKPHYHQKQE
jgi:hypothetical protein